MYRHLKTAATGLLMALAVVTTATPAAPSAATTTAVVGSISSGIPSDPCNTFIARAKSGKYKGQYLGPSDPLSLEIANVSEAAQFVIYPERRGRIEILPEHDVWFTFNDTHSGVLWDDSQGKSSGSILLECAFPLPFIAAGRLRCTTANDERVFYTCPQSGNFLGIGIDENQYSGCERLELEGISACFHL